MPDWLLNNISKLIAAAFMKQVAKRAQNLYTYDMYKAIMHGEKKGYYELMHKKLERRRLQTLVDECPNIEATLFNPKPDPNS